VTKIDTQNFAGETFVGIAMTPPVNNN